MGAYPGVGSKGLKNKTTPTAIKRMTELLDKAEKMYDAGEIDKKTRDGVRNDAKTQLKNVEKAAAANKATAKSTKTTRGRTKK